MREALAIVAEEGLPAAWARHQAAHEQLWAGLTELGLEPFVADPAERVITVNTIKVGAGAGRCLCLWSVCLRPSFSGTEGLQ